MTLPSPSMTYPMRTYCPTLYSNEYIPSAGYRKYRRVKAVSGTGFEYFNPRALAIARPCDMPIIEPSPTQMKYAAVCQRVRERSHSRSRATVSSDRWSVGPGDIAALPEKRDLKLARRRMTTILTSSVEEYPPVRARSNQYECLTHQMIHHGAMRSHVVN